MSEKVNLSEIEEKTGSSPKGKFGLARRNLTQALGGVAPFDVEWVRLEPGKTNFPCHAHQVQWEFYMVVSGHGLVRRDDREFEIGPGDAFVQKPGTAHNIRNPSQTEPLIYYVIADNPPADIVFYPDTGKWMFRPPRKLVNVVDAVYYEGEE